MEMRLENAQSHSLLGYNRCHLLDPEQYIRRQILPARNSLGESIELSREKV